MLVKISELREMISGASSENKLLEYAIKLLSEGTIDDIKEKSNRAPEEWDEVFGKLQVLPQAKLKQYLMWLERVSRSNNEPLRDISPLIISFDKAKNKQKLKGKDADINNYKTPGDLHRKLEELPGDSKIDHDAAAKDADNIYESEDFVVFMPRSVDASCSIGRGTVWCTARTKGENLFYSYILNNTILFYVIDKHNTKKKWSIGVKGGVIQPSAPNETTVDHNNKKFKFYDAFGDDWDEISTAIKNHTKKNHEHPALRDVKKAITSVPRFKKFTSGLRYDAFFDLLDTLEGKKEYKFSPEVTDYVKVSSHERLVKAASSTDEEVRRAVADSWNASPEVLDMLKNDDSDDVRAMVALNHRTGQSTLRALSSDNTYVKDHLAININTPIDVLESLSTAEDEIVRATTASNQKVSLEILNTLASDSSELVRRKVAANNLASESILLALAGDHSREVRMSVVYNLSLTPDVIRVLADKADASKDSMIQMTLAGKRDTPDDILKRWTTEFPRSQLELRASKTLKNKEKYRQDRATVLKKVKDKMR